MVENSDTSVCVLNAKTRVFITIESDGSGGFNLSTSETCGQNQKFTLAWGLGYLVGKAEKIKSKYYYIKYYLYSI